MNGGALDGQRGGKLLAAVRIDYKIRILLHASLFRLQGSHFGCLQGLTDLAVRFPPPPLRSRSPLSQQLQRPG